VAQRATIGELREADPFGKGADGGYGAPADENRVYVLKATVTYIKADADKGPWYPACLAMKGGEAGGKGGRSCNKKCERADDGGAGVEHLPAQAPGGTPGWNCRDCGPTTATHRWIVSAQVADHSGSCYLTLYDEQAQQMLGATADAVERVFMEKTGDAPEYKLVFERARYTEWLFTCKNKIATVKGELRHKTPAIKLRPCGAGEQAAKNFKADVANIKLFLAAGGVGA
jgi:replication factor A1